MYLFKLSSRVKSEDLEKAFREFVKVDKECQELTSKLKIAKSKRDVLESELLPLVEAMEDQQAEVRGAVVELQVKTTTSVSYAKMLAEALTKVNKKTAEMLVNLREAYKSVSEKKTLKVKSSGVVESFKSLIRKLKKVFSGYAQAAKEFVDLAKNG